MRDAKIKAGRPTKVANAVPLLLRVSSDMYNQLSELAPHLVESGRPLPTVQDIARRLLSGALADRALLERILNIKEKDADQGSRE